jgi:hypothetical protein
MTSSRGNCAARVGERRGGGLLDFTGPSRYIHRAFRYASSPSSRGLGHRPFTAVTRVRIP